MSLDGIAFTNLGLYRPVTPSEVVNQAEKTSQEYAEKIIKEVENIDNLKLNPDGSKKQQEENLSKNEQDKENAEDATEYEEEIFEENRLNQYTVKFNSTTNRVELIDKTTKTVIETIKPEDLISLMSKSKSHFGILVDRQI